jgi:hypothetical protein
MGWSGELNSQWVARWPGVPPTFKAVGLVHAHVHIYVEFVDRCYFSCLYVIPAEDMLNSYLKCDLNPRGLHLSGVYALTASKSGYLDTTQL